MSSFNKIPVEINKTNHLIAGYLRNGIENNDHD